jgi:hypothetical protein
MGCGEGNFPAERGINLVQRKTPVQDSHKTLFALFVQDIGGTIMASHQSQTTNKLRSTLSVPDRRRAARSTVRRCRLQVELLEDRTLLDFAPLSFLETPFPGHETPLAEHFHPHLHIFLDGVEHVIPGDTNIVEQAGGRVPQGLYPIHTHQEDLDANPPDTGKLHVESTQPFNFHLGDFFTLWTFTSGSQRIFNRQEIKMVDSNGQEVDFKADATHTITMTVDGQPNTDFENFVLTDPHAGGENLGPDIVVTGTTSASPASGNANQTFVTHCYEDFLGRQPDPGGLNYFLDLFFSQSHLASPIIKKDRHLPVAEPTRPKH